MSAATTQREAAKDGKQAHGCLTINKTITPGPRNVHRGHNSNSKIQASDNQRRETENVRIRKSLRMRTKSHACNQLQLS